MALQPSPASLSSCRKAERVERPMLLPRRAGCAGALEPAPPGLSGAEAQEGTTEVSVTPFCFCSKSALAVVSKPRKDGIPSHMRPNRFYPGPWGCFQDGEAKCFSFEKESSVRIEIFVFVSFSTESPALKIEPGA